MKLNSIYNSPIGDLLITCENNHLVGLKFIDETNVSDYKIDNDEILYKTTKWLDQYFSFIVPTINIDISLENSTVFQQIVLEETMKIPYGQTITYKDLADRVKKRRNIENMSSQAIGQALKRNPMAIIIPCHRIVGQKNNLIGYAFGLERKEYLLNLEKGKTK